MIFGVGFDEIERAVATVQPTWPFARKIGNGKWNRRNLRQIPEVCLRVPLARPESG